MTSSLLDAVETGGAAGLTYHGRWRLAMTTNPPPKAKTERLIVKGYRRRNAGL